MLDTDGWSTAVPYLPSALLDTICRHPDLLPPWIDSLDGSLVLADISGFTRMSEQLAESGKEGAEWLTGIINQYFCRMLDIADEQGGTNLKFGGDALLLLFQGEHHATRAVATALSMQQATRKFTTFRAGYHRVRLNMTAGVHSGTFWSAVAGLPQRRMQHFILGTQASQVAETQARAAPGELLISDSTKNLLGAPCLTESRGNIHRVLRLSKRRLCRFAPAEVKRPPAHSAQELFAYLPPPVVQSIRSGVHNEALEGEHRKVSITFINIFGINELGEDKGPEIVLNELQQYLSTVLRLVEQYGGFLVGNDLSANGVKLLVVFGAPVAHDQDPANALRMALELKNEVSQLNTPLRHRMGVNSGFVFSGDIGSQYCRQYTVMGDAVNLAARLMASSSPNQILVSRRVAIEAGPGFVVQELPPISVKGKREPVPICELVREHQATAIGTGTKLSKLFGRESEVESFRRVCSEVEVGNVRCVVVSGEPGTGKSRLVQEFQEHLSARHWTIHRGECYSHTSSKPFAPWVAVLNSLLGISTVDPAKIRTEEALAVISGLRPNLLELASLLNPLLSLSIPESDVIKSADDETRRRLLFELISGLLRAAAANSALCLLLEDLHWSDPSSLQLAEYLSRNLRSSALLICGTYRPKDGMALNLEPGSTVTFALSELPPDAALQLVENMLGRTELPQHVAKAILAKARGNPLFLEEVARSMRQSGALDQMLSAPSFKLADEMASLGISDHIQTLIMSRIDMLSSSTREVLRNAAVIGSTFDLSTLRSLFEARPTVITLEARLKELIQNDLVSPEQDHGQTFYRFRHALIQEIAYSSLRFSRRRELHHQIAHHVEDSHRDQLELVYEVLAHHYGQSQDGPKTRQYALKAGDKARRVFAHEEAIEYYRRALATLEGKSAELFAQRSYFLERMGDSYDSSGRHKDAARTFSQALRRWRNTVHEPATWATMPADLTEGMLPKVRMSALYHKIAISLDRNSDYDLALKKLRAALNALPPRQRLQTAKIYITKSLALFHKALYGQAIYWGRQGLAICRLSGDRRSLAYACNILANSYTAMGDLKKAIRHRHSAVRLYDELGDLSGQAIANNNLGVSYQYLGNQDKALNCFKISLNAAERIGHLTYMAMAHNNIGEVLLTKGRLNEAMDHLQNVVETYERHGHSALCGLALINLSRIYRLQQDYEKASDCLKRGTEAIRKTGARGLLVEAVLQQADLQLETGQFKSGKLCCQRALRDTHELGMKLHEARGLHLLGRIHVAHGLFEQAETNMQQSATLAKHINADYERGVALLSLAKLYGTRGSNRDYYLRSQRLLKQATAIFRRVGADADLSQALKAQAELKQ